MVDFWIFIGSIEMSEYRWDQLNTDQWVDKLRNNVRNILKIEKMRGFCVGWRRKPSF